MRVKTLLPLCILLLLARGLGAQIGISLLPGKVLPHTENLAFEAPDRAHGIAVNIMIVNREEKDWHRYFGYPTVQLKAGFQSFNEPDVLGHAFYCLPEISFYPLGRGSMVTPWLSMGTGLAWLTRKYDFTENATNNAISARINNATSLAVGLEISSGSQHAFHGGVRLTHFSNANVKKPNLGINTLAWELGYRYGLGGKEPRDTEKKQGSGRFFGELSGMFAVSEYTVPGGPKFPNYVTGAMIGIPLSRHLSLLAFSFWQYRDVERVFQESVFALEEGETTGNKLALSVGLESRFGDLAVSLLYGRDILADGPNAALGGFNIIRLQYLIPVTPVIELAPGLQFKSKEITAEYIGLMLAVRFTKKYNDEP